MAVAASKTIPLRTFLEFYKANSGRSSQNAFYKCSRALNIMFLKNSIFDECRHFSAYRTNLIVHSLKRNE